MHCVRTFVLIITFGLQNYLKRIVFVKKKKRKKRGKTHNWQTDKKKEKKQKKQREIEM